MARLSKRNCPLSAKRPASDALNIHMRVAIARPQSKVFVAKLSGLEIGSRALALGYLIKWCRKIP